MTSHDAVRHACGWAVWRALDSLAVNRELMRGWLYSGDLPAEWAGWVDGER